MSCQLNIDPYNNFPEATKKPRGGGAPAPSQIPSVGSSHTQPSSGPSADQMIHMLQSDLQEAIQYIHQLGGSWPPPSNNNPQYNTRPQRSGRTRGL